MIANSTLPDNQSHIKSLLRQSKKIRLAETRQLDHSYITVTSLPELTSKVPYYTLDGEKVKVHAEVLNSTCNRKLKWHITHQSGRFMTSSDPTMHKTVQDILSELLESEGYTVEQEYSLSFEFPEFILVNEFDLFANRGNEQVYIEIKPRYQGKVSSQIKAQLILLELLGIDASYMVYAYKYNQVLPKQLINPERDIRSLKKRMRKLFTTDIPRASRCPECRNCSYDQCEYHPKFRTTHYTVPS